MRLLPPCNEGFRRLALVVALLTAPALFGRWVLADAKWVEAGNEICAQNYIDQARNCTVDEPNCRTTLKDQEDACFKNERPSTSDRLKNWGAYALGALLGAVIAALAIRTLGWVVQGFRTA